MVPMTVNCSSTAAERDPRLRISSANFMCIPLLDCTALREGGLREAADVRESRTGFCGTPRKHRDGKAGEEINVRHQEVIVGRIMQHAGTEMMNSAVQKSS